MSPVSVVPFALRPPLARARIRCAARMLSGAAHLLGPEAPVGLLCAEASAGLRRMNTHAVAVPADVVPAPA